MRRGRFEQADGGTLFLDEIGDMPFDLQTRLLRVLSDGQFYRVGGHQPLKANVRVIAATHQNLEERVKQGSFREDLYHRLNVIRLRLPALRERREDIPMLTRFFLQKSAKELGVDAKRITEGALQRLAGFDFPGNVRQLENICHWLTVMAPSQVIEAKDLPPELGLSALAAGAMAPAVDASTEAGEGALNMPPPAPPGTAPALPAAAGLAAMATPTLSWLSDLEREARRLLESGDPEVWDALTRQFEAKLIHTALEVTRGRRIEAAQRLGIGRNTITRKIQELGLED
jgi:two-component system nitrogen regulation response regulator GlnG